MLLGGSAGYCALPFLCPGFLAGFCSSAAMLFSVSPVCCIYSVVPSLSAVPSARLRASDALSFCLIERRAAGIVLSSRRQQGWFAAGEPTGQCAGELIMRHLSHDRAVFASRVRRGHRHLNVTQRSTGLRFSRRSTPHSLASCSAGFCGN